jgi:hypothetical protein
VRPVREADNLTAIYKPFVYTMWDPQQPYRPQRPVKEIALLFYFYIADVATKYICCTQQANLSEVSSIFDSSLVIAVNLAHVNMT